EDPQAVYDRLREEVRRYSDALYQKPHLVVLTKADLLPPGAALPRLATPNAADLLAISSVAGSGLDDLKERLWRFVESAHSDEAGRNDAWTGSESPTSLWR